MKKRALIIACLILIIFQTINHFCLPTRYFGLALELEKYVTCIITLIFCLFYVARQAKQTMYSYSLMSNIGIVIFLITNILFQTWRLLFNFHEYTLPDVYQSVINSFSLHVILMTPLAVTLAVMLITSNITLMIKDKPSWHNMLGFILGIGLLTGSIVGPNIHLWLAYQLGTKSLLVDALIYFIEVFWCLSVAYFECMMLAAIICTLKAATHVPALDRDFMIILGCKVDQDGRPLPILQGRIERAMEFARAQQQENGPVLTYVPSGGKGSDEVVSEAEAMKKYLLEREVARPQIITEDRSQTTRENMQFSKKIIDRQQPQAKIVFATTDYHVWRSGVLAHDVGLPAVGIGARAPWYFYINALVREFAANLYAQRRQHIFNLIFILLNALVVMGMGYQLGLGQWS